MKVAIISFTANLTNGSGNITYNYCNALSKKGREFTLFLPFDHEHVDAPWADRVRRILPRIPLRYGHPRFLVTAMARVEQFRGFDLIHSLFALPCAFIGYRAARRFDVPFIMGAQGTYGIIPFLHSPDRHIFTRILDRADRLILPSEFTRSAILSFHDTGGLERRAVVIHNGLDFQKFAVGQTGQSRGSKAPEFIGIGALKRRKGFHVCIAAMKEVVKRHPDATYKLIGGAPGPYEQYLRTMVKDLNLQRHVIFVGSLPNDRLPQEMRNSFAYLHTPICHNWNFEGFGIVYLEANACGLPAIGSRSGGVPEAVKDGFTGLLCRERDSDSTVASMIRLIEDEALYMAMRKNALAWAEEHDWSYIADRYLTCYDEVLRG